MKTDTKKMKKLILDFLKKKEIAFTSVSVIIKSFGCCICINEMARYEHEVLAFLSSYVYIWHQAVFMEENGLTVYLMSHFEPIFAKSNYMFFCENKKLETMSSSKISKYKLS